ncbi:MAG: DUF6029 family protein [Calditrichaceae bacterium]
MKNKYYLLPLVLILFTGAITSGQISVSNRLEYQLGNIPDSGQPAHYNLYNQMNLDYRYNNFSAGLRTESFEVTNDDHRYNQISQKYIKFQNNHFQIRLGNFFDILGRGLLLRTYEIPGVTFEDIGTRQHYGFFKDIEGVSAGYTGDFFQAKVLYGKPLDLTRPPTNDRDLRRPNLLQAGEINFSLGNLMTPGLLYLRQDYQNEITEFGGFNLSGNGISGSQYYVEYVQDLDDANDPFRLGTESRHAFYSSVSFSYNRISIIAEYKDYHEFTLNFNDPPQLVREHSFILLNRSTHSVEPQDERGFQLESLINLNGLNTLTLNHARATNEFGSFKRTFQEYHADINYYLNDYFLIRPFINWSEDPIIDVYERMTAGITLEHDFLSIWSLAVDIQAQKFDRNYRFNQEQNHTTKNGYLGLSFTRAPNLAGGLAFELTNDPVENNTLNPLQNDIYKSWLGFSLNYQINQNHSTALFYGKRRGGNACTGGICYQVQPFEGLEFRLNSLF